MRITIVGEQGQRAREEKEHRAMETTTDLPAVLATDAASARPAPLVPERTDFLEGDAPAAAKVEAFLARALEATGSEAPSTAGRWCPGSATRCCRTTRSRRMAAT